MTVREGPALVSAHAHVNGLASAQGVPGGGRPTTAFAAKPLAAKPLAASRCRSTTMRPIARPSRRPVGAGTADRLASRNDACFDGSRIADARSPPLD
jgi:hypothetical protein